MWLFTVPHMTGHKVMDKDGETILHWACKSGKENYEMVEMLLEKYVTKRTYPV